MAREWRNDGRNKANQRFGTCDGEGGDIPDPDLLFGTRHVYQLLRADEFQLENPAGLDFRQCANFLSDLPRNRIWTGYFFDYDVTKICESLPEERARRLFDPTLRVREGSDFSFPTIDYDGFDFGYIPHKEFKIRRQGQRDYTVISDTGPFFQARFVGVDDEHPGTLEKWGIGTPEEIAMLRKGKAMRGDFTEMTQEIDDYNALECLKHNELMEAFRQTCRDVGYVPGKWQGPGNLASAMLKAHGVPKREDIPIMGNWRFRELANAAYYGGRAETTVVGPVPGPIYQWDINGAYVSALRFLPCLIHGSWKFVRTRPSSTALWVGKVEFGHDRSRLLYNLPVRKDDGNIFFPRYGSGHYWSWELDAAELAGTRFTFLEGWVYEPHCSCRPFDWIDAYYAERLRLGKSGKGIVLKLGGNSIYGKIAQSIGYAPWANPVWAGLITAYCRAKIIRAYLDDPDDVLMIMTDGLFMRHRPNLPESTKLGEWELKVHASLFVVQPGIYFLPGGHHKTRGVPLGRVAKVEDVFRERFDEFARTMVLPEPVAVPVDNFITMRQALARRKWNLAGTWEHTDRKISYDWTNKRLGSGLVWERSGMLPGLLRTLPPVSDVSVSSKPYDKIIGGSMNVSPFDRWSDHSIEERVNESEQPDWNEGLVE